ncbi:MAG: hypothetical protein QNK45_03585 [Flavobacteriaceae bacterium]
MFDRLKSFFKKSVLGWVILLLIFVRVLIRGPLFAEYRQKRIKTGLEKVVEDSILRIEDSIQDALFWEEYIEEGLVPQKNN